MRNGDKGFTLIELMIVVAIIAIIASIAIPNLLSARLNANETAAIATLRNLSSAQAQLQAGSKIDVDQDGSGEFGYFAELAGGIEIRGPGGATLAAINPPVLSAAFRTVNSGVVTRSGYVFRLFLPDADGVGIPEADDGGATGCDVNADNCETTWCAYAWPANYGTSGNRVFFVNQQGDVVQTSNQGANQQYSGLITVPAPSAAFLNPSTDGSIMGMVAVNTDGATDGGRWLAVN